MSQKPEFEPIAIVGMACLFPDAQTIDEYWDNIRQGKDSIGDIPATHWSPQDYYDEDPKRKDYTYAKKGGFLRPFRFNPIHYGITPQSIEATDTTQLLGMVVADEALRNAGYGPERDFDRDKVSCILGVTGTLELVIPLGARLAHPKWRKALLAAGLSKEDTQGLIDEMSASFVDWQENSFPGLLGNVVAGRIANRLNLGGSNNVTDAACASSLAALQTAVMELQTHRADMVLTGGMDTFNDIFMYMCFSKTPALSPTGNAKPFDANGDGTILGEGLGAVVLKRLSDAKRDGDKIIALIKGIGSSSDGKGKAIYAPSAKGQVKALKRCYELAKVEASSIALVECHGTGTKVGDGVELEALDEVFSESLQTNNSLLKTAVGSVKSQIGHTKAAAGAAGLIKAAMALYHKVLPPTIKVEQPHPRLVGSKSKFTYQLHARPWVAYSDTPRRAAVSAFGFGGSNFHCLLEEAESKKIQTDFPSSFIPLVYCSTSVDELEVKLQQLISLKQESIEYLEYLKLESSRCLKRAHQNSGEIRLVCLVPAEQAKSFLEHAKNSLRSVYEGKLDIEGLYLSDSAIAGELGFLFSGQGSQTPNMLRELCLIFPEAIEVLDLVDRVFSEVNPEIDYRLSDKIFPPTNEESISDLTSTRLAQPAIGAMSLVLLKLLSRFGVDANKLAGHSFGELSALRAAGVYSDEAFLKAACVRGRLMEEAAAGGDLGRMLAVKASIDQLSGLVESTGTGVVIANHNSPDQVVVAGSSEAIEAFAKVLKENKIRGIPLKVGAAFHSPIIASAAEQFEGFLKSIEFSGFEKQVYSNLTAKPYSEDIQQIAPQLASQLASKVEFVNMLGKMRADGVSHWVELGPQSILANLVHANIPEAKVIAVGAKNPKGAWYQLLSALAQFFVAGIDVDWSSIELASFVNSQQAAKDSFHFPICGANYQDKKDRPVAKPLSVVQEVFQAKEKIQQSERKINELEKRKFSKPLEEKKPVMETTRKSASKIELIEKHLLAMQQMQATNAELHQAYLRGQAKTQEMIGDLMGQYQSLLSQGSGFTNEVRVKPSKQETHPEVALELKPDSVLKSQVFNAPVKVAESEAKLEPVSTNQQMREPVPTSQSASVQVKLANKSSDMKAQVKSIISAKTGYPEQILEDSVELEADLGIDSIKRVEIFSALQEIAPQLQELEAEELAALSKVGDLVALVSEEQQQKITSESVSNSPADFDLILNVIAEKTGYPKQMLEPEMELEADLGIDSIKRVEIFSELQTLIPELASLDAEQMQSVVKLSDLSSLSVAQDQKRQGASAFEAEQEDAFLFDVIAEKTGYPKEMLKPEMELESDLGIDSIKRVEILSAVSEKYPHVSELDQDHLQSIVSLSDLSKAMQSESAEVSSSLGKPEAAEGQPAVSLDLTETLERSLIRLEKVAVNASRLAPASIVWVTDDGSNLARNLVLRLKDEGHFPKLISISSVERLKAPEHLDGLIVLVPSKIEGSPSKFLTRAFSLVKLLSVSVKGPQHDARRAFISFVSRNGGHFGFEGIENASQAFGAGLSGLAKTLRREWPSVSVNALDIGKDFASGREVAEAILNYCRQSDYAELAVSKQALSVPRLYKEKQAVKEPFPLDSSDRILITGGAKGVTFAVAKRLAARGVKLVIWGRTSAQLSLLDKWPEAKTRAQLMQCFVKESEFESLTPKELQAQADKLISERLLSENLKTLESLASELIYQQVDVRSDSSIAQALEELGQKSLNLSGFIHGAGILADKKIEDLDSKDFAGVIETKLKVLNHFSHALLSDLRFAVFFSSSTARFGRIGQSAYATANECLNKFAQYLSANTSTRALAVNWGPWDGGMVDDSLKKLFLSEGLAAIPLEMGADFFESELAQASAAEMVCLARPKKTLAESVEFPISTKIMPALLDHVIKGQVVFPVVMHLELAAFACSQFSPELRSVGFSDLKILRGLKFPAEVSIQARAVVVESEALEQGVDLKLNVEFFDEPKQLWVISSQMVMHLSEGARQAKPCEIQGFETGTDLDVTKAYEEFLFHGPKFQGIETLIGLENQGVSAQIRCAPETETWIEKPFLAQWFFDPLALDCAFQMGVLWSSSHCNQRSLPTGIAHYEQYVEQLPSQGVRVNFKVISGKDKQLLADIEWVDQSGNLLARLDRYQAVMDTSLSEAFTRREPEVLA